MTQCFTYCMPTHVEFGEGLFRKLKRAQLPGHRVLLLSGEKMDRLYGFTNLLKNILTEQGVNYICCEGIRDIINENDARTIANLGKREGSNCIVALGGAACMNAAKIVSSIGIQHQQESIQNEELAMEECLPIVCIPTVPEIASFLPYGFMKSQGKLIQIKDKKLHAYRCIIDPGITETLPPRQTTQLGFIALLAALNVLLQDKSPLPAKVLARHAWKQLIESIPLCVAQGKQKPARRAAAAATLLAAMAAATGSCPPEIAIALSIDATVHGDTVGHILTSLGPEWHEQSEHSHHTRYRNVQHLLHLNHPISTELRRFLTRCGHGASYHSALNEASGFPAARG